MIFRLILHLSMRGTHEKYQLPLIRWPTWSLALDSSYSTPSQLGSTPSTDPYVWMYYLCHQCPTLLFYALLSSVVLCCAELYSVEPWRRRIDRECLITFSIDPKSVSSKESVSYHSYWPKVSFIDPKSISQESVSNHSYWSHISWRSS